MEQNNILENDNHKVVEMWECDWTKLKNTLSNKKELEEIARHQNINVRNAFYGGRTEDFKQYHKCVGNKIFALDIVSLYPTVNALDDYAVWCGRYVYDLTVDDIMNDKFIGIVKVDIEPPT